MKPLRELLFERHRQAEPKLDAVRRRVVATLAPHANTAGFQHSAPKMLLSLAILRRAWLELIWPCRRAWASLAALWLVVLAANIQMKATSPSMPAARSAPTHEVAHAFQEQRRILAELLPPVKPLPIHAPRPDARPRSDRPTLFKAC
jgi:hypothetical protein